MDKYYKKCLQEGLQYQDFITEKLYNTGIILITYVSKRYQNTRGENKLGIEIKYDKKLHQTNNLYIETAEKTKAFNKNYIPSGINRNDATWLYLIGNYNIAYIFSKRQLKLLAKKYKTIEIGRQTSIGFLLPIKDAIKFYAIQTLNFDK